MASPLAHRPRFGSDGREVEGLPPPRLTRRIHAWLPGVAGVDDRAAPA
jgi:hypothetical protein